MSKHRKRSISNMCRDRLLELSSVLQDHVTSSWMEKSNWTTFKQPLTQLIESLSSYASYLSIRSKAMKLHHSSSTPPVNFSDASAVKYLPKSSSVSSLLSRLDSAVCNADMYQAIDVNDYLPKELRPKYLCIRELEKGLSCPIFFSLTPMDQM